MIQPHELMIGNYVWNPYNEPTNVDMSILTYLYKCKRDQQKNVMYFPIPLNKEWLIKLGFEYRELTHDFYIKRGQQKEILIIKNITVFLCESNSMPKFICNLEYVHELQNLYLSLTGEQLTIKE